MATPGLDYSYYFWQGSKIRLRAFAPDDAIERFAQSLDSISREEFNIGIELPTTVDKQRAYLEQYAGCAQVNNTIAFAVETHKNDYVGMATMNSINEGHGKFSFSVFIGRQFRKQGYAEDAVRLILRYGFLERRMEKCHSACASYNTASIHLHQKLGFIQEGRLRNEYFSHGKRHDELLFGMMVEEYIAMNHSGH